MRDRQEASAFSLHAGIGYWLFIYLFIQKEQQMNLLMLPNPPLSYVQVKLNIYRIQIIWGWTYRLVEIKIVKGKN